MKTSVAVSLLLAAAAEARFGQEQGNGAIAAIQALSNLGQPGQAATLAGNAIQFLLAAANPCGKLSHADSILEELGTSDAAVAAARGLVAAEQNFNPFVLRGVVPLIDPAVVGSDLENKNAAASKTKPFAADGLSVAQVMVQNGFSNFTAVALDGSKSDASGGSSAAGSSAAAPVATSASAAQASAPPATAVNNNAGCNIATAEASSAPASSGNASSGNASSGNGSGAVKNAVTGNFDGFVASTIAGLDFGLCVPTMKFEAGLDGRSDTEFTFQAIDPLVNKGQEEALNPNIITNRIHDQLTNVCGANAAAKAAVADAQAKISALGTRNADTANTWNSLLGFANTNINPDNAPQAGLVGHT
ncbi:hypothetical protein T069G_02141 [Trichoderma breve]|uniref:Circumsporozoite protein n=1 Tax=Trichoderma breve TaxID=2034170 RepID=A0A9W9EFF8_9HYPO|nr:hypothetical protein T069G_02141 [Trichoderma breve]KAJ4865611.1 hypothetical protein T069G_02141 [Trichoderma breve]